MRQDGSQRKKGHTEDKQFAGGKPPFQRDRIDPFKLSYASDPKLKRKKASSFDSVNAVVVVNTWKDTCAKLSS